MDMCLQVFLRLLSSYHKHPYFVRNVCVKGLTSLSNVSHTRHVLIEHVMLFKKVNLTIVFVYFKSDDRRDSIVILYCSLAEILNKFLFKASFFLLYFTVTIINHLLQRKD